MLAITGATGRLGLNLVRALIAKKEKFFCIVRSEASAKKLPKGVKWRLASLENGAGLQKALEGATAVANLAGSIDTRLSTRELMIANATATSHLFTALPSTVKRVVHISSISVYGKRLRHVPSDEFQMPQPDCPYAASKLAGERIARTHSLRFPVIVLRPAIIYGPGFEEGFFPILKNIEEEKMQIIGNGENHIPLIHSDDVVSAILLALKSNRAGLAIYNIAPSPEDTPTQMEVFAMAASALKKPAPSSSIPYTFALLTIGARQAALSLAGKKTSFTADMVDQIAMDRMFDTSLAKKELGWERRIGLKEGISQTLSEYREWKHGKNSRHSS